MISFRQFFIERNLLNKEDLIEDLEKKIIPKANSVEAKEWIRRNFVKWYINQSDRFPGEESHIPGKKDPDWAQGKTDVVLYISLVGYIKTRLEHIVDYFNSLDERSLSKISRFSFDDAYAKAHQWTEDLNAKASDQEDLKGIEVVHEWPDGFKMVKLISKQSYEREGKLMNHCVGSYFEEVADNWVTIFSLRDPNNNPHVTIEVGPNEYDLESAAWHDDGAEEDGAEEDGDENEDGIDEETYNRICSETQGINQIKGKNNEPVNPKYHQYVWDWINTGNIPINDESELQNISDESWIK